jgi:broad specificity phosphatase PhoE
MANVVIVFVTHATSLDNEAGIASGHADPALSARGRLQALDLGVRLHPEQFAAVFCSDLRRSWETAELAFGVSGVPIVRDRRLRECDYGALTQHPVAEIERERSRRVQEPFPNGESYAQAAIRVKGFVDDLPAIFYAGRRVLVIGHRATQYGLEHWLNSIPLAQAVVAPWSWQPSWTYEIEVAPNEKAGTEPS